MAVICIFKLKNDKYFVLRMDGDNLKNINNFVFENDSHELKDFLSTEILESEWIKKNPISSLELIEYSPNESDEEYFTRKLMKKYGIDNVRSGNYIDAKLSQEKLLELENGIKTF